MTTLAVLGSANLELPSIDETLRRTVVALDIVGHGVFSPAGQGLPPIAAALAGAGRAVAQQPPDESWPRLPVRTVADFDPMAVLGRKGLSRMSRTDQLAMAACLSAVGPSATGPASERTGIVLGVNVGSAGAQEAFFRDSFVQERPYLVNPSAFPGTLMNSAAGRTAIRLGVTGMNATVSGGSLASLHALRYARNALVNGHADRLLVGGVEEASEPSAWAWHRSGALRPGSALGEGCAVFVLQREDLHGSTDDGGDRRLGKLLACEIGFADPATQGPLGVARRLADCVRSALMRSGLPATEPVAVAPGAGARRGWGGIERRALRSAIGSVPQSRLVRIDDVFGETYAAGVALQLAAVLARWQDGVTTPDNERAALVTTVGPDGSVGALVVARPTAH
ncbi:beta-ketoacyl synthase N-terminal-like domain-containing protein [Streptomyces sp. NPDC091387]|uniref:beta-ketoacyl synthase N-terminal-like domain-containing protein n=1 Tax=Streptomyces sp. NPDC091387 TaxID=3365998 RepID=UPI00381E73AD